MVMYNYGEICILGDFMKEKTIDSISFYIIDFMLDYYTKKYIELGKKCLEDAYKYNKNNYMPFSKDFLKNDTTFEEINRKIQLIRNYLNSNYKIPSNSVFYFFTLLPPYEVKTLSKTQNLRTANNVYFDRDTPNEPILKEGKNISKKEEIQKYLKEFFIGYRQ